MVVPIVSMLRYRPSGILSLFALTIRTRVPCPRQTSSAYVYSCTILHFPSFFANLLLGDFNVSANNSQPGTVDFSTRGRQGRTPSVELSTAWSVIYRTRAFVGLRSSLDSYLVDRLLLRHRDNLVYRYQRGPFPPGLVLVERLIQLNELEGFLAHKRCFLPISC